MTTQTLQCRPGNHVWRRESQRGKPPSACPEHSVKRASKATVIQPISKEAAVDFVLTAVGSGPAISGVALADRLQFMLESRGTSIRQQRDKAYSGPRY